MAGISIHPPREGWDRTAIRCRYAATISIHPPREGWDGCCQCSQGAAGNFNPPTP